MYYNGRFYKAIEELEQDIKLREESMTACYQSKKMEELAKLQVENLRMLSYMKKCETRSEARVLLHTDIGPLITEFETALLQIDALRRIYSTQKVIMDILDENEFARALLEEMWHMALRKNPVKLRMVRQYYEKKEALDFVERLRKESVLYYDNKKKNIYFTDNGIAILSIMLF